MHFSKSHLVALFRGFIVDPGINLAHVFSAKLFSCRLSLTTTYYQTDKNMFLCCTLATQVDFLLRDHFSFCTLSTLEIISQS